MTTLFVCLFILGCFFACEQKGDLYTVTVIDPPHEQWTETEKTLTQNEYILPFYF